MKENNKWIIIDNSNNTKMICCNPNGTVIKLTTNNDLFVLTDVSSTRHMVLLVTTYHKTNKIFMGMH